MDFQSFKNKYEKVPVEECPNKCSVKPLLSVCIFTFNQEKYIRRCIDGALQQQTNFDYEIVLGDDDSNDGTREICLEYAQKFPDKIRLLLHHRENNIKINGHPTGRFNVLYGYYSSKGKYIAICEGDDYWTDPLKLQKQVDFLEGHPDYSICYHKVSVLNAADGNIKESQLNPYTDFRTFSVKDLSQGNFIETVSVMFRNQRMDQLPDWFAKSPVGDYPLHMLNARKGKIGFLPDNMAVYRHHPTSYWSSQSGISQRINLLTTLDLFIKGFKEDKEVVDGLIRQRFSYMNDIAYAKLNEKDENSFNSFYKASVQLYPEFSDYWLDHGFAQFRKEKENLEHSLNTIKSSTTYRTLRKIRIFK